MAGRIEPYVRGINNEFIESLLAGQLNGFLMLAKSSPNVCLEIRKNYINLYYRGGNAVRISSTKIPNTFKCKFDEKYLINKPKPGSSEILNILEKGNPSDFLINFDGIAHEMDTWLDFHFNAERDFQHNLIKMNQGKLRIIDIEYAGQTSDKHKFRIDMIAIYSDLNGDKLILIENKYGNNLDGSSGLRKHFNDISTIINDPETYNQLIHSVNKIIQIKRKLGLVDWDQEPLVNPCTEVLFILANFSKDINYVRKVMRQEQLSIPVKVIILPPSDTKLTAAIDYANAITL